MTNNEKKGLQIVEGDEGSYYKIDLPASWDIHIKEECASSDGRVFLGPGFAGSQILWIVEPKIGFEVQSKEKDMLHFLGKVNGNYKGVSKALSNGRLTVGKKHAHKRILMFIVKEELSEVEFSLLKGFILLK